MPDISNTQGIVHGRPLHSDHRRNPTTVSPRHKTCRIPTRHGKCTSFPREPVPCKNMDTGTFTIGNIIPNRHPTLSALTHPGRVQQNFQQLKMESSNMVALPCFNFNAEATPQMETSKKGPGADAVQDGRDTTVTSSRATPMDHPMDNIQPPTRKCISTMNVHSQDSHSNKSDRLKKSKVQGNRLTRFSHHSNTDFTCDQKSLPRDLHNYWNNRETLPTNLKMDTNMNTNRMTTIPMAHKEVYLLSRPLKAMAH